MSRVGSNGSMNVQKRGKVDQICYHLNLELLVYRGTLAATQFRAYLMCMFKRPEARRIRIRQPSRDEFPGSQDSLRLSKVPSASLSP